MNVLKASFYELAVAEGTMPRRMMVVCLKMNVEGVVAVHDF